MSKYRVVNVSMPEEFFKEVDQLAKEENRTRSELYREALRQYLDARKFARLQRETATRARDLGITTEEDVERVVDSVRLGKRNKKSA